jgi:hypothetical protein
MYRHKTWFLTLREEHRVTVIENKVLRRIFGLKRDEATGVFCRLHNEKLHDLYSSPSMIRMIRSRKMRLAGHVARMRNKGGMRRRMHIRRPRYKWVDNIKMYVGGMEWGGKDWFGLAHDRDQWRAVMNLRVP